MDELRDTQYNLPIGTDLISRQAAIDVLKNRWLKTRNYEGIGEDIAEECEIYLMMLPSAQPEPCEDAVNRETILKFFDGWMSALDENCHNQSVSDLKIIKRDFANLLPVTPKQRTGKWIKTARWRNVYKCDKCGNYLDFSGVNAGRGDANFCPNCGAKMEVTE